MAVITVVVSLGLMARAGQYTNSRRLSVMVDVGILCRDVLIALAVATLLNYLTKGFFTGRANPSRLTLGTFVAGYVVLAAVSRSFLRVYQRRLFAHGRGVRKVVVVGDGSTADELVDFISTRPWLGVVPVARVACHDEDEMVSENLSSEQLKSAVDGDGPRVAVAHSIDGLRRLNSVLRTTGATEVVVALDLEDHDKLPQITELLDLAHVPFKVVPSLFEETYRSTEILGYAELPVIDVNVDPLDRVARIFKRGLDVAVAGLTGVILLPLELALALAIVCETGFPVLFKQERVGKNGRRFLIYKFRSMVRDAEAAQKDLPQDEREGPHFWVAEDPRVTKVGKFMRKWSLDELPQLLNVLGGEMSLVGPRPPLPSEVDKYEKQHLVRLKGKPGMTGLWQVSGRKNLMFDDMVRLDRYYLENWSIRLDLAVLVKTFWVLITRDGAY